MRPSGRTASQIRPVTITRNFTCHAEGSVLIEFGNTKVLCNATVEEGVPRFMKGQGKGWVTAEYSMLPGSTSPRKRRERSKIDGRTSEIQRLIGRSLRSVVDFEALGPRTITIDCDVLEADGGTRTASITGGYVALVEALRSIDDLPSDRRVVRENVAAISVGIVDGQVLLDLPYVEDVAAEVDMNVVMTSEGEYVEVQGTAESQTFSRQLLNQQLDFAEKGIRELVALQNEVLGRAG